MGHRIFDTSARREFSDEKEKAGNMLMLSGDLLFDGAGGLVG